MLLTSPTQVPSSADREEVRYPGYFCSTMGCYRRRDAEYGEMTSPRVLPCM